MRLVIHKLSRPAGGYRKDHPKSASKLASDGTFGGCALVENVLALENRLPLGSLRPVPPKMSSGPQNIPGSVLETPDELARTWPPEPEAPNLISRCRQSLRPVCAGQTANGK